MTVVMGYPPRPHGTVTGTAFSAAAGGGEQGVSPAERESRGKIWHTTLLARCSVLHPAKAGCKNRDGFFSRRGGFTSRKRREKPTPARSVCGVFSRRVAGRRSKKHCHRRHACHPKGKTIGFHFAVSSVTDAGGIPTSLSLLSSLSSASFVSAISLPSFFLRYA